MPRARSGFATCWDASTARPATWSTGGGPAWPDGRETPPGTLRRSRATLSRVSDDQAGDTLATALAAFALLAELGETVEDEWTYVTRLGEVGRARLRAAVLPAGGMVSPEGVAAIEALAVEVGRITDPHRAIDWLSTFPAVAELALGGGPVAAPARPPAGGA